MIYLLMLIYSYMHYGTMAMFGLMGVYKDRSKELRRDLIPFMWIRTVYNDVFGSDQKLF